MQNSNEVSINQQIGLEETKLPNYDYGYWLIVFFSFVMLFFILSQVLRLIEKDEITLVGNSLKTVIGIVGIIMSYSVTKSLEGDLKHTWKILTWAYIFNTGGDTIWYYYASILNEKPFPSWADVSFLIHYPVMLWALLRYPTKSRGFDKKKLIADISIVMVSGTTLVWYFIINPTITGIKEEDYISPALNISYTVGDMVLILGILVVFFRGVEQNLVRALQLIVSGVVCMLIADLGFAYLTLQGTYFGGHWIENFFIFNSLSHIYAAYYQFKKEKSETQTQEIIQSHESFINWLPYIAIFFGVILLAWESREYWDQTLGKVVLSSIVLTVLVVFRQRIAVKDNIQLNKEKIHQQSELKFKALVENSSDMISIRDFSGKIIFRSPSTKNIIGYEPEEIESFTSYELIHPEDADEFQELFGKLETGEIKTFKKEFRFKHKNGFWLAMEGIAKRVDDDESQLHGIIINSRDISQRKLDEERLQMMMEKLKQSNQELEDFAYVASHDLQEPLRKVQSFGERLNKKYSENLGNEGSDYIRRMQDAATRMQSLIEGLLTYSRVSTKAQPFVETNLDKICREVVSDLEVRIEQTEAIVEILELPKIEGDSLQMRQLFQNLISNALKFQTEGTNPKVKIYSEKLPDQEIYQIFVSDNGIGFDEKYLDRIFGVFQRLHGRSEYEGSGIGLSVCKKIVERHNGEITAKSKIGEGTTFIITLPSQSDNTLRNSLTSISRENLKIEF